MEHLAYAVVMAMEYLNLRNDEDYDEDSDAAFLGELAHLLQNAPSEVKNQVKQASLRLLNEEKEREEPSAEKLADYENFMDEYFLNENDE